MEAKIDFNDEQISQAIQAAILSEIDSVTRDGIIKAAIIHLTTPEKSRLDGKTEETPLMRAFYRAAERIMEKIVEEEIKKEGSKLKEAVRSCVVDGVEDWLSKHKEERSELVSKISSAISKAITPEGRYY
jgi:tryptophanyl-tRNA synthetase